MNIKMLVGFIVLAAAVGFGGYYISTKSGATQVTPAATIEAADTMKKDDAMVKDTMATSSVKDSMGKESSSTMHVDAMMEVKTPKSQ